MDLEPAGLCSPQKKVCSRENPEGCSGKCELQPVKCVLTQRISIPTQHLQSLHRGHPSPLTTLQFPHRGHVPTHHPADAPELNTHPRAALGLWPQPWVRGSECDCQTAKETEKSVAQPRPHTARTGGLSQGYIQPAQQPGFLRLKRQD